MRREFVEVGFVETEFIEVEFIEEGVFRNRVY